MVIITRRNLRRFWGSDGIVGGKRSLFIQVALELYFWNGKTKEEAGINVTDKAQILI